jgi:hypothetical protein
MESLQDTLYSHCLWVDEQLVLCRLLSCHCPLDLLLCCLQDMSPSNLASVLAGLARLHHYDEQLCTLLADAAETAMPAASGSQVSAGVSCDITQNSRIS